MNSVPGGTGMTGREYEAPAIRELSPDEVDAFLRRERARLERERIEDRDDYPLF